MYRYDRALFLNLDYFRFQRILFSLQFNQFTGNALTVSAVQNVLNDPINLTGNLYQSLFLHAEFRCCGSTKSLNFFLKFGSELVQVFRVQQASTKTFKDTFFGLRT